MKSMLRSRTHIGAPGHRVQEPLQRGLHRLLGGPLALWRCGSGTAGEVVKVIGLGLVELECAGEGIENLGGHASEVPAFHPRVILDTDPGEDGYLFPAQPGNAAASPADDARLTGGDPVPAGAQELRYLCSMIHSTNANATRHDVGGTASTRISSDSRTRA
jgi:hypothetical protein